MNQKTRRPRGALIPDVMGYDLKTTADAMRTLLWSATMVAWVIGTGCNGSPLPAQPSPPQIQPPRPFVQAAGSNGSFTWVSIPGSRPLCTEITGQVGQSWSLWLQIEEVGDDVTLTLAEGPLPPGPFDEAPATFTGQRQANVITASRTGPMGGMACRRDAGITPQTGGELTATISDKQIASEYTEIFGTGAMQVTFAFRFEATLK